MTAYPTISMCNTKVAKLLILHFFRACIFPSFIKIILFYQCSIVDEFSDAIFSLMSSVSKTWFSCLLFLHICVKFSQINVDSKYTIRKICNFIAILIKKNNYLKLLHVSSSSQILLFLIIFLFIQDPFYLVIHVYYCSNFKTCKI